MAKRKPPEPEYVYVVSLFGYHKIGRSKNVNNRVRSLTLALPPEPLTLVLSGRVYNANKVENYLHKLFASKRVRGEWFRLASKDLDEIQQILESKKTCCGCMLHDGGPPQHCAEAARLRRELPPPIDMPIEKEKFLRLPYVQHFLYL